MKTMSKDDPRLTAYALGELDDAGCRDVEEALAHDPELAQELDAILSFSRELEVHFAADPLPELDRERQERIVEGPRPKPVLRFLNRFLLFAGPLAAAAMLLLVVAPRYFPSTEQGADVLNRRESLNEERSLPVPVRIPVTDATLGKTADEGDSPASRVFEGNEAPLDDAQGLAKTEHIETEEWEIGLPDSPELDGVQAEQVAAAPPVLEKIPPSPALNSVSEHVGGEAKDVRRMEAAKPAASPKVKGDGAARVRQEAPLAESAEEAPSIASGDLLSQPLHDPNAVEDSAASSLNYFVDGKVLPPVAPSAPEPAFNTESYATLIENDFIQVDDDPLSTFSIDVDTASYTNVRRFLNQGMLPPADAVRIEEMVNYFHYDDPEPEEGTPFSATIEMAPAPWQQRHYLLRLGLKAPEVDWKHRQPCNLVFLIDVSGSMSDANKLPLVKSAMSMLVRQLDERDRVSIVTYAGQSGVALPPTNGARSDLIMATIERLGAGGGTHGAGGIQKAYDMAKAHFDPTHLNRVILATDGDFNLGITNNGDLVRFVEERAKQGIFLTVLGVGTGNYKDDRLEALADKGNGNYAYLDSQAEASKVLVEELGGTLFTVAKDVKFQLEFNPLQIGAYRLIGYENRVMAHKDFNNDKKDAGDVGAGHSLTVLYELIPRANLKTQAEVDALKYQTDMATTAAAQSGEWLTLKMRYKQPKSEVSKLLVWSLTGEPQELQATTEDFRFSAAVAAFGMRLRGSEHLGDFDFAQILRMAGGAIGADSKGHRAEFLSLVHQARRLINRD